MKGRKRNSEGERRALGLPYFTSCVRAFLPYGSVLQTQQPPNSTTTSVSKCLSHSLLLPLFCYNSLALSHPLQCPLYCTFSLSYLLSLCVCPSPPLSVCRHPPPIPPHPPSEHFLFSSHSVHVSLPCGWPSLSLASAVCALHGEEAAVVRL